MATLTTFIGASDMRSIYKEAVHEFAKKTRGHRVVFGGDPNGMMGELGNAVVAAGGELVGVTTDVLVDKVGVFDGLSEEIRTADFNERKQKMIELSDYIICFPGGNGTFEEIFQAISWRNCGLHDSPCIFLNINGYYDLIRAHYIVQHKEGVIGSEYFSRIKFIDSIDELISFIEG